MRLDIWYHEELDAMRALVEDAIRRTDPLDYLKMVALGGLHRKIEAALKVAPSARTPEAAA